MTSPKFSTARDGEIQAADELLPLVFQELRGIVGGFGMRRQSLPLGF